MQKIFKNLKRYIAPIAVSFLFVAGATYAVNVDNIMQTSFVSQNANEFLLSPNGSSGVPTFRTVVAEDLAPVVDTQDEVVLNNYLMENPNVTITRGYTNLVKVNINNDPRIIAVNLNSLTTLSDGLSLDNLVNLNSVDFLNLTTIGGSLDFNGNVSFSGLLDLSNVATIAQNANINSNPNLQDVDFTSLTNAQYLGITANPSLTNITLTSVFSGTSLQMIDNALSVASVDAILVALDTAGQSNGSVDLSGGTNGQPSGTGLTASANLMGRGWTVNHN